MQPEILTNLGIQEKPIGLRHRAQWIKTTGKKTPARSPINGQTLANVTWAQSADVGRAVSAAQEAFLRWRLVPAPKRGDSSAASGKKLRARQSGSRRTRVGRSREITAEALGEVQE